MVWRAFVSVFGAAFAGTLVIGATLQALMASVPIEPDQILLGAASLMIFTVPGALIVLGLVARLRAHGLGAVTSSLLAILCGGLVGAGMLIPLGDGLEIGVFGAFAGSTTALCCVALHAWLFPATRRRS